MSKALLVCAVLGLAGAKASAQVSATCDAPQAIDKYQLLRRLSLDLRGVPPSMDEYNALDSLDGVPDATVQNYLQSDGFRQAMRHYHELMFWPNVTNVALGNTNSALTNTSGYIRGNVVIEHLASLGRQNTFRKFTGFSCGDDVQPDGGLSFLQTHFLDGGGFQPDPAYVVTVALPDGGTAKDEGYRMVVPYWDPTQTAIPVCAYDAQETKTSSMKDASGNPLACNDFRANNDPTCGCGPNLSYCYGGAGAQNAQQAILMSLREQLNRSVDDVTAGGHPYTDLITSSKAWENGTIAFWRKNLAPNLSYTNVVALPDPNEQLAPVSWDFANPTWTQVDRGDARHAGVTTLPAYFLRFQTDRGRANRFRINFQCEYFVPQTTLTAQPGCDPAAPDLTNRCYCQYCHSKLEPLAEYFGMFSEAGTTLLANNPMFPAVQKSCTQGNGPNSAYCQRYYVTATDTSLNPGALLPLQWVPQHGPSNGDYQAHLDSGPNGWAQSIIADHTFAQCQAQKVFAYFIKRPMLLGTGDASDESAVLSNLASGFESNGFSFPWLVQQVVTLPQYRRAH